MTKEPLRIVLILSRIEQTGVTTHTLDLTEGLVKEGHEVFLITGGVTEDKSDRVYQFYEEFKSLGVPITEFITPEGGKLRKLGDSFRLVLQIRKAIKRINPQVIHVQSPYLTFIPWLLGKKYLTTLHNTRLTRSLKFKKPTHMIAISEESKAMSQRVFGIAEKDITIVNHGVKDRFRTSVNEDEKLRLKAKHDISTDKIVIGCVGRTTWQKGCDVLIEAAARLSASDKENIQLLFLGGEEGTPPHRWIHDEINKNKVAGFTKVIPFQDPKPFYDIFDIFVLPSRMESFPLVPVEAMMSGCAVIRSDTEGAFEQTYHEKDGIIFKSEDVAQLTEQLTSLINDRKSRERLGKNAKDKALERFTIPVMTKNTITLYQRFKNY